MSLFSKAAKLAASPQGRAAIAKAKVAANDPKNRAKIDGLVNKVKAKGGQSTTPPAATTETTPDSTPSNTTDSGPDRTPDSPTQP